jgi:hypothetical protein
MWISKLAFVLAVATGSPVGSCVGFVNQYLAAGWPSGSTIEVKLVGEAENEATLTLEYPRYPRVAGVLRGVTPDGSALQLGVEDGVLRLQLTNGDNTQRLTPSECSGATLVLAA